MIFRKSKKNSREATPSEAAGDDEMRPLDAVVFERFFSGDFQGALELYRSREPQLWSGDSTHYAFAAAVTLSEPTDSIVRHLPRPIERSEFDHQIREQLKQEARAATRGLLRQPEHLSKILLAAGIGLARNRPFFVETGTYTGQSVMSVSGLFDRLWTVEASPLLFAASQRLFAEANINHLEGHLGDSKKLLALLPKEVLDRAVIFLDAHYSTGVTSRDFGACPVLDEIGYIFERAENALVVVDDLRTMNGNNGYPTLTDVLNSIPSRVSAEIAFDQLIVGGPSVRDLFASNFLA